MDSNGFAGIARDMSNVNINDGPSAPYAMYNDLPPPAPRLKSPGVVAMDITKQFADAAQQLDVGQLVKDPYFTLFESVGALEIMDKKMDSGCLDIGETMEDEYDFSQSLLPEEIIGIIDQLLCHEMAWHMGHPLAQTIFTSLYIDRLLSPCPLSLDQTYFHETHAIRSSEPLTLRILRAYCIGLIKTCSYINERVKAEHFYEEEDFVVHTFNRSLLEGIEHDNILRFLDETIKLLADSEAIAPNAKAALDYRLRFRAQFLKVVELVDSRTSNTITEEWTKLRELLPFLKSTTSSGLPTPSSYSVKIQRKLASTVPPRPIVQVSQEDAFSHLERLCRDATVAVEVLKYYDSQSLMTFVILFQARKPQPSVYVRTLLQHYIFADMIILGTKSIRHILDDDLAATVLPNHILLDRRNDDIEVVHDARHKMATRMETFRARAAGSYLDILRTICQNRCRIRRGLCHSITDWDNLQLDAEELDVELRALTGEDPIVDREITTEPIYSFPLSSWAYFYKLKQMEWIVQMGFELEVYQPDELASMYWYVQYLAKTRSRHLERIRGFDMRSFTAARKDPSMSLDKIREYSNAISFVNYSSMEAAATYGFADALSCLFTVLTRLSLLQVPPRPYSDNTMRYEVRMKPFMGIGLPELIPFDDLVKVVTQPEEPTLDLLQFAAESVTGAKKGFEVLSKLGPKEAHCQGSHDSWLNNIKACLKACIFTSITIATVKKAMEVAGKKGKDEKPKVRVEIPPAGKGYHDWWIVPKVIAVP